MMTGHEPKQDINQLDLVMSFERKVDRGAIDRARLGLDETTHCELSPLNE